MKRTISVFLLLILLVSAVSAQDAEDTYLYYAHAAYTAEGIDFLVNGEVVREGYSFGSIGGAKDLMPPGMTTISVRTASYQIVAVLATDDFELLAGHEYIVIFHDDAAGYALSLFDLTEAGGGVGSGTADASPWFTINLVDGLTYTYEVNGEIVIDQLGVGEIAAYLAPIEPFDTNRILLNDDLEEVYQYDSEGAFGEPYYSAINIVMGLYPGEFDETYHIAVKEYVSADPITFLHARSGLGMASYTYNNFVNAVDASGLADEFVTDEWIAVIVPGDEAFAAMSGEELDTWLAEVDVLDYLAPDQSFFSAISPGESMQVEVSSGTTFTYLFDEDYDLFWGGTEIIDWFFAGDSFLIFIDGIPIPTE